MQRTEKFNYAHANSCIVFTHDLDFGDILAATGVDSPSVIQVRTQNPVPETLSDVLLESIRRFEQHLKSGALITINLNTARARVLPI